MERAKTSVRQVSITRPANATLYTAGDAIGNGIVAGDAVIQFPPNSADDPASGRVVSARLWKDDVDVVADGFTLLLFQKLPTANPADNEAPTTSFIAIADAGSYIGSIVFNDVGIVLAAGVYYESPAVMVPPDGLPFQSPDQSGVLYGILTAVGAYTPSSGEVFTVTLEIQQ